MDPLNELWELWEGLQQKPELEMGANAMMGGPNSQDPIKGQSDASGEHPVSVMRKKVDAARAAGVPTSKAHETVHGEVDLADVTQKANLAGTFARVQNDGNRNMVTVDKDSPQPSIMAQDLELEKQDSVSPEDMKTKLPMQDTQEPFQQAEELEIKEEIDYNLDVQYLQKYGRA